MRFGPLPPGGYTGRPPAWPLTRATVRERTVWNAAWKTPQAAAWATEPWRHRTVAMWVRWSVRMEAGDAPAAVGTVVMRLADQIGLTPAGMRENRWVILELPNSAPAAATEPASRVPPPMEGRTDPRRRLTVVPHEGASNG